MGTELVRNSGTPLYMQVRDIIAHRIETGQFAKGHLLPSINELCQEFEVSTITVRQALELLVNDGLVGTHPGRGTYVRDRRQSPSDLKKSTLLYLHPHDSPESELYAFQIRKQCDRAAHAAGFNLQDCSLHPERLREYLEQHADSACGMLLLSTYSAVADVIGDVDLPVVVFTDDPEALDQRHAKDVVNVGDYEGTIELVDYLASLGHTKIATIYGQLKVYQARRRLDGYMDAVRAHGIEPPPEYIVDGQWHIEEGKEAAGKLLDLDDPPTAIVCANDYSAVGAMTAIRERGLDIPGDISITGFDDMEVCAYTYPPLTTTQVDRPLVGDTLIRLMVERLNNPDKPFESVTLKPHIKIRKSCKAPSA